MEILHFKMIDRLMFQKGKHLRKGEVLGSSPSENNMLYCNSLLYHRIIKYLDFEPIHCTIILELCHSLKFLTNLIMCSYQIYCYFNLNH